MNLNFLRRGYLLLGILLAFSLLVLSSSVGILDRDTRLKRFQETQMTKDLESIRRSIEQFQYYYGKVASNSAKIAALSAALGTPDTLMNFLASEGFLRERVGGTGAKWRLVRNLVKNPSFEDDGLASVPAPIAGWMGNFTENDSVPNGWQLTATGAEQMLDLSFGPGTPATFVVSFWSRSASPTAKVECIVTRQDSSKIILHAQTPQWKRTFGTFNAPFTGAIRLEINQISGNSGDLALVDGVMLEEWTPPPDSPAGFLPVPSAWAASFSVSPGMASAAVKQYQALQEILASAAPASLSWLLEW